MQILPLPPLSTLRALTCLQACILEHGSLSANLDNLAVLYFE